MWLCPKCQRSFRNTNQLHTCKLVDKQDFFRKRPEYLYKLYKSIHKEVSAFGDFREEAVAPDVIFFKTKSTFLAVKVKSKWLDIEFFLEKVEDAPPVKKFLQTSKNRAAHIVSIDEAEDIDKQLIDWMRRSYRLIIEA